MWENELCLSWPAGSTGSEKYKWWILYEVVLVVQGKPLCVASPVPAEELLFRHLRVGFESRELIHHVGVHLRVRLDEDHAPIDASLHFIV